MTVAGAVAHWPRKALFRLAFAPARRTVTIAALRCNDKPIARQQGFGGKPIELFPVYRFFRQYLDDPTAAEAAFRSWYREWFLVREGWRQAKSEGGLAGGSLQRAVEDAHRRRHGRAPASPAEVTVDLVEEAIEERVRHYFSVLESIRDVGFDPDRRPPILAVESQGLCFLRNGHHRCAALAALGHSQVPLVVVDRLRFLGRPSPRLWEALR